MKIFAALYLISPGFVCLKLLGFSSERAEGERKEGKFTVHLEKMQSALTPECERPRERAAPPLSWCPPLPHCVWLRPGDWEVRAGPCCKGELRTLPLCVGTALAFLTGNEAPASPGGDLPTSAPSLLWYLTEVFSNFPCCSWRCDQLLDVDPSPFSSPASFWDEQICLLPAVAAVQLASANASHELDGGVPPLHHRVSLLAPRYCFCSYIMSRQQRCPSRWAAASTLLCSPSSHVRGLCCGSDAVSPWCAPAPCSHSCPAGG